MTTNDFHDVYNIQYLSSGFSGIPNSPVRNILLISSIFSWTGKETKKEKSNAVNESDISQGRTLAPFSVELTYKST